MKNASTSPSRARLRRRPGFYRPQLLSLEDRLPLGDTLFGAVLGASLAGPSLYRPLDPGLEASESTLTRLRAGRDSDRASESASSTRAFSLIPFPLREEPIENEGSRAPTPLAYKFTGSNNGDPALPHSATPWEDFLSWGLTADPSNAFQPTAHSRRHLARLGTAAHSQPAPVGEGLGSVSARQTGAIGFGPGQPVGPALGRTGLPDQAVRNALGALPAASQGTAGTPGLKKQASEETSGRLPMTLEPSSWSITVNGTDTGRVFEGIGAISGGGATSRLLLEYPPDQRKDILDYLFRPNFGAGFQHLKVEIGGDVFSSEGTEPSYAHTREEFLNPTAGTFNRGYEWRIMEEAKARNPDIKFSALEWGAPGWIGTGSSDREKFYSQDNIDYIIQFVNGAHDYHDLTIDYVGTWNEVAHDVPWIKHLRTAVDGNNAAHGYATKIIAADSGDWSIADDMAQDPDLASAVDVVGVHYPWFDSNPPYGSTQVARDLGKPLWASEDGVYVLGPWSGNWESTKELARIYNRNYAVGRMTQTTLWNLVTSYYDNLPLPDAGPLKANSPWSGHYDVGPGVWVTAHTTQFAQPGWQYLDSATGLSYDPSGSPTGSYVTLKSPNNTDYSVIVETTQATSRAAVTFHITGGLSAGTVHVWRTNQTSSFVQLSDITPGPDGTFSLTLDPESIYSLTTTAGQQKGTASASIPPAASFPFPYADDFEAYGLGQMARYLSDQGGSFEVALPAAGTGQVYRQVVPSRGIEWAPPNGWLTPDPYTLLGDGQWSDYRVSVSAYIGSAASPTAYMAVLGRIHSVPGSITFRPWPDAYELYLDRTGLWKLERTRFTPGTPESYEIIDLAAGEIAGFDPTAWHQLALDFRGTTITALVDGAEVGQVTDTTYGQGMAGFGSGWHVAEFDSFSVS